MNWRSSQITWDGGRRNACARTDFSGLGFGTSCESGSKIKDAQNFFIHFPKDRNCEVCLRTKITRASCWRRTGEEAVPQADNFGHLMTVDHKVFNEEGESRNNHRYAVVTRDLATQWVQSCPCKTKTSQETEKCSKKFFSSRHTEAKSYLH